METFTARIGPPLVYLAEIFVPNLFTETCNRLSDGLFSIDFSNGCLDM